MRMGEEKYVEIPLALAVDSAAAAAGAVLVIDMEMIQHFQWSQRPFHDHLMVKLC